MPGYSICRNRPGRCCIQACIHVIQESPFCKCRSLRFSAPGRAHIWNMTAHGSFCYCPSMGMLHCHGFYIAHFTFAYKVTLALSWLQPRNRNHKKCNAETHRNQDNETVTTTTAVTRNHNPQPQGNHKKTSNHQSNHKVTTKP